ncbi:GNAT family N-acetyltransferase [Ideonella sp. YS5]|uniref:GNAT family N-acetyltransferase n=1 Tax=Ideonella sp. YS5 TaxID=3453714 RepID=UPI003F707FC1
MPSLRRGDEVPAAEWHAAFTEAFCDYLIGPFVLSLAQWPGFLARQGVDLALSRAAVVRGELAAFALVAPRPATRRWRLATMGARPSARGSGVAAALLDDFIGRATGTGLATVELEVFAANERAWRLYRGRGFDVVHPLMGYERPPAAQAPGPAVEAVPLQAAWSWLAEAEARIADLPLQVTAPVLRVAAAAAPGSHPLQAWRHGSAQMVFAEQPSGAAVVVHSLIDDGPAQADAQALAEALAARYPGRTLRVPALQRPDLGGQALECAGFVPQPMHQWLMRRTLE